MYTSGDGVTYMAENTGAKCFELEVVLPIAGLSQL
jgi:hypothetical protein